MIINGVYGKNLNELEPESTITTVPKEGMQTNSFQDFVKLDSMPVSANNGYITYTSQDIQKKLEETGEDVNVPEKLPNDGSELMTSEDYKEIEEEGISLEKYEEERLSRVLARIKAQRAELKEYVEDQVESKHENEEAIKKVAHSNITSKRIAKKLEESGLPVTKANIAKIATAMELTLGADKLTDHAMTYLIKNNLKPTIGNLYKAQYSQNTRYEETGQYLSQEVYKSLENQVYEIIDKAGFNPDEETVASAKWLLDNKLPLTEDTLWAYRDLKRIKENCDPNMVLDKAVKAIAEGKNPEEASLSMIDEEKTARAIELFTSIDDDTIKEAIKSYDVDKINGKILYKAKQQQNAQKKDKEEVQKGIIELSQEELAQLDIKTITVRRQLEEIRLKLTLESGKQLIKNGIKLDTDSLSKIVDSLKELEDKYYQNLLKEGKATITSDNIEILKQSMDGVAELKTIPSYILGSTLSTRNTETVSSLVTAGTALKNNLEKAGQVYETLMTKPRADLGDSITKAFRNVDDILQDMNLEITQANERAVRILGYNNIAITEENIQHVKSYDQQVNQLMNNLTPAVTVELIKRGINPLNIPINELNQQIDEIKNEIGVTETEKYSKYLWKLEKSNKIAKEEKESYIGIYRLLNAVDKTDGAALGAVLKADREVNLNNLLTAVRTMKHKGVDLSVNDEFGALTKFNPVGESITDQINTSFLQSQDIVADDSGINTEKLEYMNQLIKEIKDEIAPDRLNKVGDMENILNMSIEKLNEELRASQEEDSSYWDHKLQEYHKIQEGAESARELLRSFDIPASMPNIQAAKDFLSTDNTLYKQIHKLLKVNQEESNTDNSNENSNISEIDLEDMSDNLVEAFTSPEKVKEQYQAISQNVEQLLSHLEDSPVITSSDLATLQRIRYGMSFVQNLASKESYEVPLIVNDSVTNVNVTILRNTGESGKVNIQVYSENLGNMSVSLAVKEKGINALITCENRSSLDLMKEKNPALMDAIRSTGVGVEQLNYGIGNIITDFYRYNNYNSDGNSIENSSEKAKVSTDALYSLAKTFLVHIKNVEYGLEK